MHRQFKNYQYYLAHIPVFLRFTRFNDRRTINRCFLVFIYVNYPVVLICYIRIMKSYAQNDDGAAADDDGGGDGVGGSN